MMDNVMLSVVLQQLVASAPVLIVYVIGIMVALLSVRRCPLPSMLTVLAMGLFLFTRIGATLLQAYLFQSGRAATDMARMMSVIAVATSLLHAVGLGLLLTAVFIQRRSADEPLPSEGALPTRGSPFGK